MLVVVLTYAILILVNLWSYLNSADFRLRRWFRRGRVNPYIGFAHAEQEGVRIRPVDLIVDGRVRAIAVARPIVAGLVIGAVLSVSLLIGAPAWVCAIILTAILLPNLSPVASLSRLRHITAMDSDSRRARRIAFARVLAEWLGLFVGILLFCIAATGQQQSWEVLDWSLWLLVSFGVIALVAQSTIRGKRIVSRLETPKREGAHATRAAAGNTLLLRSFSDDEMSMRAVNPTIGTLGAVFGYAVRFEELLAAFVTDGGNLVALGKPGEDLPQLGAVRTYVDHNDWRSTVESAAHQAASVVLVAGKTDSLGWELKNLGQWGLLSKTVVMLPPVGEDDAWVRLYRVLEQMSIKFDHLDANSAPWLGVLFRTATAIGLSQSGKPVFYVSDRRDWLSFVATLVTAQKYIAGVLDPPLHGQIANVAGFGVAVEPQ